VEKKAYIVFDLGPGDGGKGGVVHKLSCHHQAHTVIKVGGAQGSHGVSTGKQEFAFSQWGCGTFEGVGTHITPLMVVSPEGLLNEADGLRYAGVTNAFDLLTIDARAICATPYHGIASRVKEMARGSNPRGTIGTGVGEAFRDSQTNPELVIRAGDLCGVIHDKLLQVLDFQVAKLNEISKDEFLDSDYQAVKDELSLLTDPRFFAHIVDRFQEAGRLAQVVWSGHLTTILDTDGVVIVESSHGILTDKHYGFHPHVSAIRTLPQFAHNMLRIAGFDDEISTIGVHRAYTIKHGAGPMPTADASMAEDLLPGSHKENNRFQGDVRVGPLDLMLLRYAIDVCGGPKKIDGLAITWFDQIAKNGVWHICDKYANNNCDSFVTADRIKKFEGDLIDLLAYQHKLSSSLFKCEPEISSIELPDSRDEQYRLCDNLMRDKLGVPVNLVSFGPTERDRLLKEECHD
jgi:adenylosuccinate synthase